MGHNRARERRHARIKRNKREMQRLEAKAEAAGQPANAQHGLVGKVKDIAKEAAHKVGAAVHAVEGVVKSAIHKVTGKS